MGALSDVETESEPEEAMTTHIRYTGDGAPDRGLSCGALVLEALRQHQHLTRPSQVDAHLGTAMSFKELLVQTVLAAEGWRLTGLGKGDTVALVSRNQHEAFPAVLGAMVAGLTVACAVPTATPSELRHALTLVQPRMVISEPDKLALSREAYPGAPHMVLRGDAPDGVMTFQELMRKGEAADPPPDPDTYEAADVGEDRTEHVGFVLFSSGTTGLPKGVRLRDTLNTLLIHNITAVMQPRDGEGVYMDVDQTLLISSPLCWVSGVWQTLRGIIFANTRVFCSTTDDVMVMSVIDKYKIDTWMAAPAVLVAFVSLYLSHYRERYDLSSLKTILVGGSPTSAEVQESVAKDLNVQVVQVYGATEAGFVFGPTSAEPAPYGSLGKLVPWVELRLVDPDTGDDIPASTKNKVGEARVRSPYLLHSYVNNPEETAKACDELGFYKTGDLVYEDDDGYFFFVDRIKEMMKFKNLQIAPAEIEMVLLQHPGIQEACVLGKSDPVVGDLPTAFVSRAFNEEGEALTEDDVKALVADKLSDYKQLRGGVIFLEKLPKTVTGKIARRELKEMLRALP
ncbi:luciferin 4-monooxygenase-like isoform X2 [Thrips palmi]|uniref:Luciferin 4-monooxygenase-like isoform X2 n=1 Tax=Thrips palmi TaxID=161013 RepID=A0A6P8ZZG2_THRPL|nr:luciferin 4-monooxygenase-like isoform X2 [Thrips palmi]